MEGLMVKHKALAKVPSHRLTEPENIYKLNLILAKKTFIFPYAKSFA